MHTAILSTILSLAPYHLLSWGTLLGMELYQSFVMTKLCYRHLPLSQFVQLQQNVFPVYFAGQAGLVALTAATYPPLSIVSLARSRALWTVHVPLGVNAVMAGLNAVVYGPKTTAAMLERERVKRDGTVNSPDARHANASADAERKTTMDRVRRDFSHNHAMSIHLNAIAMVATVWYGVGLASKLRFVP